MRQRAEEMEAYSSGSGHYTKEDIKLAAKDVKSWVHGVIQIAVVTILYGTWVSEPLHSVMILRSAGSRFRHFPSHHHQGRISILHCSGAVLGHSTQPLGCSRLRRWRNLVGQVYFAVHAVDNLRADRHSRLRDSSRPCLRSCAVLRDLPDRYCLLPVHWWQHVRSLERESRARKEEY